jgi:crossover junction endodeoxyribonuclease RuvC
MRVLGIDPGTLNLGYGIVDEENGEVSLVDCGVFILSSKIPVEQRLSSLYQSINGILARYSPDEVAIEEPFVADNARSALALGRAQAIAILAAANMKLPIFRYSPAEVKLQVTSYGNSSKEQVQEMVKIQLKPDKSIKSSDAADALAVAICHFHLGRLKNLLAKG